MMFADMLLRARARRGVMLGGGDNFDPDQPRGDDGKWTSGGGGGSGKGEGRKHRDTSKKPTMYQGRRAPRETRRELVKRSKRDLSATERDVSRARAKTDAAREKIPEAEAAHEAAVQRENDATKKYDDAFANAVEREGHDDEKRIDALPEVARAKREMRNAERETRRAERRLEAAQDRLADREEDRDEAENSRDRASDWHELHKIDETDSDEQREQAIDRKRDDARADLRHAERDRAEAERDRATAERAADEAHEEAEKMRREAHDLAWSGEENWDEAARLQKEADAHAKPAFRELRRAEARLHSAERVVSSRQDSVQFWDDAKAGDLSDWDDGTHGTDDDEPPPEGTEEDRDGDGLVGDEEEQDDDEHSNPS